MIKYKLHPVSNEVGSMSEEEAISRIQDHIVVHKLNEPNKGHYLYIALQKAIRALETQGCGCGICLSHNHMKCPRYIDDEMSSD